jgi:hypothetical protein
MVERATDVVAAATEILVRCVGRDGIMTCLKATAVLLME